jgi:hypothetical protein
VLLSYKHRFGTVLMLCIAAALLTNAITLVLVKSRSNRCERRRIKGYCVRMLCCVRATSVEFSDS